MTIYGLVKILRRRRKGRNLKLWGSVRNFKKKTASWSTSSNGPISAGVRRASRHDNTRPADPTSNQPTLDQQAQLSTAIAQPFQSVSENCHFASESTCRFSQPPQSTWTTNQAFQPASGKSLFVSESTNPACQTPQACWTTGKTFEPKSTLLRSHFLHQTSRPVFNVR